MRRTLLYCIWDSMKRRCEKPNNQHYDRYGARGIKVCPEWHDFSSFQGWALSHGYRDGLSIDRIDNDGDYCPDNCQWISTQDNVAKSLEAIICVDGVEGNLRAWADLLGASTSTVSYHLNGRGLPVDEWIRQRVRRPLLDEAA